MSINYVAVEGNLTRDPERRYTRDGKPVVSFSIAQNTLNPDGSEHVSYFDCVKFCTTDKQADFFSSLCKGQRVVVSGRLRYDRREKDGRTYTNISIRVHEIAPCSIPDGEKKQATYAAPKAATPPPPDGVYDEDIPF